MLHNYNVKKQITPGMHPRLFAIRDNSMVDLARKNWNCVLSDLMILCERLEDLGMGTTCRGDVLTH